MANNLVQTLNEIALKYQSPQTTLVVSPTIYASLEAQFGRFGSANFVSLSSSAAPGMTWKGIVLPHCTVYADQTLSDTNINVYTQGSVQNVTSVLGLATTVPSSGLPLLP